MSSGAGSVITAVRGYIQIDHTTQNPAGTHDLSGADSVQLGRFSMPPVASGFVAIAISGYTTSRASDALGPIPSGLYGRALELELVGWAPIVAAATPEARITAGLELADDITRALAAHRGFTAGTVYVEDSETEITEIGGQEVVGSAGGAWGLVRLRWTGYYRDTAGI